MVHASNPIILGTSEAETENHKPTLSSETLSQRETETKTEEVSSIK